MSDYILFNNANTFTSLDTTLSTMITGDSLEVLKKIPDECVQTIISSPPYWSQRYYGIKGQIGLTEDIKVFINSLARNFDEAKRLLREYGTLWLNIGDSYTSGNRKWRAQDEKNPA